MNTMIKNTTAIRENSNTAIDTASRTTIVVMGAVSGLIGLWAIACMVGALASNGPVALVRGFISAVTGV